jgi:hypothetical protein
MKIELANMLEMKKVAKILKKTIKTWGRKHFKPA